MDLRKLVAEAMDVDVSVITDDFEFRAHSAWDSLAALSLISSIEDEVGVVVSGTELKQVRTVSELHGLIAGRLA